MEVRLSCEKRTSRGSSRVIERPPLGSVVSRCARRTELRFLWRHHTLGALSGTMRSWLAARPPCVRSPRAQAPAMRRMAARGRVMPRPRPSCCCWERPLAGAATAR